MAKIHAVHCKTVPGEEGYPTFTFLVNRNQAQAVWNLAKHNSSSPVPLGGKKTIRRKGSWLVYSDPQAEGADRHSILLEESVIAQMEKVLRP